MKDRIKRKISGVFQGLLNDQPWRIGRNQERTPAESASERAGKERLAAAYRYVAEHPEEFSPGRFDVLR